MATRQKPLILILMRELASNLATPIFLVDAEGTLVFFNEAAEGVLGMSQADAGELAREEWAGMFSPEDLGGRALPPDEVPLSRALDERRPVHASLRLTGRDGVRRSIAVTAFPLLSAPEEFAGAVAIFWEDRPPHAYEGDLPGDET